MKILLLKILMILSFCAAYGQNALKITGGHVKISGASHIVLNNTDLINRGTLEASTSTVRFTGTSSNVLESGGGSFYNLQINKNTGKKVSLLDDLSISNQLEFLTNGNVLEVDSADLYIETSGSIVGYSADRYIVTDSTGRVVKQDLNSFTFPVGFDASTYNPLTLVESGTVDAIGVRCLEHVLDGGELGLALTSGVADASWALSEEVIGGSNLSVTTQWNGTDELTGFDRTDSGIMRYHDGDWDLSVSEMGAASGNDPYTRSGTIADMGVISVGAAEWINRVQLAARVFLQGPFSGALMTDHLRSKGLIPLTEPYTDLGYSHQGRGGNETIVSSVLDVMGDDAITDWIVVELRDKNNPSAVLETISALLQRDGDIVDLDGISSVRLPVLDDDYFVAIHHRNHLGIRTPVAKSLEEASSAMYDFTTVSAQAHGTNPMEEISTGVWGMWGGNATGDDKVRATGPPTINDYSNLLNYLGGPTNIVPDVYTRQDFNMDGNVRATGPPTINDYAKLLNILGGATNIIIEQL